MKEQENFIPATLIKKKRAGDVHTRAELKFLVDQYTAGKIPDYQMSAWLMAVYFNGMTPAETADFVKIMIESGKRVDMSDLKIPKLDKHSTGGIGDKPTLILAPLLASVGVAMPTMSGRGLGHTGGTLDKLESIPGMNVFLTLDRFKELAATVGVAFIGQTEEICPADRKLYALRDVTATVESVPLIVGSIMSKKLAEGVDGVLFDIKVGSGAFMRTFEAARELAAALIATAHSAGRIARAYITDMSQPLGHAVGNAIEVNEAVGFLRQGPMDKPVEPRLRKLTLDLAVEMYLMAEHLKGTKNPPSPSVVRELLEASLASGRAYSKFLEIVSLQGGDTEAIDRGLPLAKKEFEFVSADKGFIGPMDAEAIGLALIELGGSRRSSADKIDPSVGFYFHKFIGDAVKKGECIATIYARDAKTAEIARAMLEKAISIVDNQPVIPMLITEKL